MGNLSEDHRKRPSSGEVLLYSAWGPLLAISALLTASIFMLFLLELLGVDAALLFEQVRLHNPVLSPRLNYHM